MFKVLTNRVQRIEEFLVIKRERQCEKEKNAELKQKNEDLNKKITKKNVETSENISNGR